MSRFEDFQMWYWARERENGASEEDIMAYPTVRMLAAMAQWVQLNR